MLSWREIWDAKAKEQDPLSMAGRAKSGNEGLTAAANWARTTLQLTSSDVMLDLGCGPGLMSHRLCKSVDRVHAIDLSENLLTVAKRLTLEGSNISWCSGRANALPFASGTFSKALVYSVYQFLGSEDEIIASLNELRRVSMTGAVALVAGNPDPRKKEELREKLESDQVDSQLAELTLNGTQWCDQAAMLKFARICGFKGTPMAITRPAWYSFYMYDLLLEAL